MKPNDMKKEKANKKHVIMGVLSSMKQEPSHVTNINITLTPESDTDTESTDGNTEDVVKDTDPYEQAQNRTMKEHADKELASKKAMQDDEVIKSDINLLAKKMNKMDTESILSELDRIIAKNSLDNPAIENAVNKDTTFFKKKRTVAVL